MRHNLAAPDAFAEVMNTLNWEMLNSPDTLPVLVAGFASMAWSTALGSPLLGLPDLA